MYGSRLAVALLVSGAVFADTGATPKARVPAATNANAKKAIAPTAPTPAAAPSPADSGFKQHVAPVLTKVCSQCHNERLASGGLNVLTFTDPGTLKSNREGWETIVRQVRGGDMPPRGLPRPSVAETDAFVKYIDDAFEQDDRSRKPDPGRITARRLNRSEYSNTIRDLLGIEFRADRTFPTDDSATDSTISPMSSQFPRC